MNPEEGSLAKPAAATLPRALRWALSAGLLLTLWLLWGFDPLPIADLPEHAAQIALLFSLSDPTYPFAGQYEINPFTPYLLAYLLAAFFALVLPISLAFKALLTTIAGLLLWATLRFLRRVGADPWWALMALPLFFGLSFVWGFLNFLLAIPLVLLLVEVAYGHGLNPTRRSGWQIAVLGVLLFFSHGMACAFGIALAGTLCWLLSTSWRAAWRGLLPLAPAILVMFTWSLLGAEVGGKVRWLGLLPRLSLHRRLLSDFKDVEASIWSMALLLLVLLWLVAEGRGLALLTPRQAWARRLPLLFTLAYVALMPEHIEPLSFAGSRFVVFVPLFAGFWLGPAARPWLRYLLLPLTLGWLLVLLFRFGDESRQLASLNPILEALPARAKLLAIRLDDGKSRFGIAMNLHQPAWYTVQKGGQVDFSFAYYRTELVRYRAGRQPDIPEGMLHTPWRFDLKTLAGSYYDYWLIFAPPGSELFHGLPEDRFTLRIHSNSWWLYETRQAP